MTRQSGAIGIAIEAELGNRQGQRTDLTEPPENFPEVSGKETRQIAAEKAARVEVLTQVLTGRIAPQPLRRLVPWSPSLCPETAPATQAGDRPQPAPAARQRPRGAAGIGE